MGCLQSVIILICSPDPKGHVSYCCNFVSFVVVRRHQYSSLKPLSQLMSYSGVRQYI